MSIQSEGGEARVKQLATQSIGYYASRKPKLLRSFDETAELVRDFVASEYGPEYAEILYQETRREYEELIPEIPHLVGRNAGPLNSFLMITAQEVAVWKAMKKNGKTLGEAWGICHEALKRRMARFSKIKGWLLTQLMYSGFLKRMMRKRAAEGIHIRSGDFEIKYIMGDGKEFDYGTDYVACGNYKFVLDQGVPEFAPYVCMSDIALGKALGWGLIRTETLADGSERCDFRFKKGGELRISSKTPDVQATIERIREKEA